MMKEWFKEAIQHKTYRYVNEYEDFIIYKGFKLTYTNNKYILKDTRKNDFYTCVSKKDLKIINEKGFIKGIDYLSNNRNKRRINLYETKIVQLMTDIKRFESIINKRPIFYHKKIKNAYNNINKYTDSLLFYKSKVEQFNKKYKNE